MKAYHFLLTLLALVDGIFCVFATFSSYHDWQNSYQLSEFACLYAMPFGRYLLPSMSLWLVAFISHERYKNIVHPFASKTTIKKYAALLFGISCASFGITYVQRITLSSVLHGEPGRLNCYFAWAVTRLEFHLTFLLIYALPLLGLIGFMSYYYVRISRYMKREAKRSQNVMAVGQRIRKRNQKALKVLLLLILLLVFSVVPAKGFYYFWLNHIYFGTKSEIINWRSWKIWIIIEYASYVSNMLNNILNCVVYAKMMSDYRKFLKNIFTLGLLRRKTRGNKFAARQNVALNKDK